MSRFTLIAAAARPPAEAPPPKIEGIDRRQALAWLTAGTSLAMASCGRPHEEIIPYVHQPEGLATGTAQRYATTLSLGGYGRGAVAICNDGRPTKLEGSTAHPYSLGSTDVFAEAAVLSLYDPSRLQAVEGPDGPTSWDMLRTALGARLARLSRQGGAGFTLVTGRITSPSELRLISALQTRYPKMQWRRIEAVDDDAAREGAKLAFGRDAVVLPHLEQAKVIVCLDADPLGAGPAQIANARAYAATRKPGSAMSRLYAAEGGWSLTGANADHRLPLHPSLVRNLMLRVAQRLGAPAQDAPLSPEAARFADVCAADLLAHPGAALVLAGPAQPAEVHALAHWMNGRLKAPVSAIAPVDPHPQGCMASLQALAADLHGGRVDTLVVLGPNPAYAAPADLALEAGLKRAGFALHFTLRPDETSAACGWRAPLSHGLESWGDLRAPDGTASLVQPTVRPLYASRSPLECLSLLADVEPRKGYDIVRETWGKAGQGALSAPPAAPAASSAPPAVGGVGASWTAMLTSGALSGTAAKPFDLAATSIPKVQPAGAAPPLVLALSPDPTLYDGAHAANAWLQECPKPLTSEVWGASLAVSPQDASAHGLKDGDHVAVAANGRSVIVPIRVTEGQAPGVVSGFIGGGRRAAGPIGTGVGVDYAPLRTAAAPWLIPVSLSPARGHGHPPAFQTMHRLDGEGRKLSPEVTLAVLPALKASPLDKTPRDPPSLLPTAEPYRPAWAMVIDTAACIGCNACVVSCQAENNVPVVGPDEVARGRDMHWLRIDAYDVGHGEEHRPAFQPVPCMQCEHAPCEPVCPVEASVHDHEGLNDQVYNRCIGTRFCQSNCPYKVRRFNWYGYSHDQAYANMGADSVDAQKNPDVTVRARGVMEKCTYCVQRISSARRAAEKEDRPIGAHEVVTACQSACPTQAIHFGDMTEPASGIAELRDDVRHYALLGELGTRPRTTYLARLRNPNPALEAGGSA